MKWICRWNPVGGGPRPRRRLQTIFESMVDFDGHHRLPSTGGVYGKPEGPPDSSFGKEVPNGREKKRNNDQTLSAEKMDAKGFCANTSDDRAESRPIYNGSIMGGRRDEHWARYVRLSSALEGRLGDCRLRRRVKEEERRSKGRGKENADAVVAGVARFSAANQPNEEASRNRDEKQRRDPDAKSSAAFELSAGRRGTMKSCADEGRVIAIEYLSSRISTDVHPPTPPMPQRISGQSRMGGHCEGRMWLRVECLGRVREQEGVHTRNEDHGEGGDRAPGEGTYLTLKIILPQEAGWRKLCASDYDPRTGLIHGRWIETKTVAGSKASKNMQKGANFQKLKPSTTRVSQSRNR
ncbi:hypothetical protein DFH07DRAFT_775836 [Mycena maculata]|uniref:Uncharacterized protein n=1 Tax=Mycena maculata TaxID=230809 RepID=A0AAD7IS70_9AGAR|nr:hypothetical protein DFH07DRAFT_775836 [Mycena maculata]